MPIATTDKPPEPNTGTPSADAVPAAQLPGRWRRTAGWLAAAWLVPTASHLIGVDWLLPPLVLCVTAGLLRAGRTLLDRFILATMLLIGATCAAGLLFTVWPFGLAPVPIAGTALTALALIHALARRRFRLPRPTLGDALTAGAALALTAYAALPYLRADQTGRLALLMGEDHARHVSIFDTLRRIGGYAYRHTPDQIPDMYHLLRFYPSGWHLTTGMLDGFVRSGTEVGAMPGAMDHYLGFVIGTYALLALTVLWAAQWIAGPLLTFWRRLPLLAFLCVQLGYGDLPALNVYGFTSQILGLAMLAVLVAVLVRRPGQVRELAALVAGLLVGIGFAYELLLPPAVLAVVVWAWRNRAVVRPDLPALAAITATGGVLSVVPMALGALYGSHATLIRNSGAILAPPRGLLLTLSLVLAAALLTPAGRRLRVWRSYTWTLLAVLTLPAAIQAYRVLAVSPATYYLEKAWHAVLLALLVGCGAVVLLLPPPRPVRRTGRFGRVAAAMPAVLVAAAIAAAGGVLTEDMPYKPGTAEALTRNAHAGLAAQQEGRRPWAESVLRIDARVPAQPRSATLVLTDSTYETYIQTLYLTAVQRTSGVTDRVLYRHPYGFTDPQLLAEIIAGAGVPVLVVVTSSRAKQTLDQVRQLRPDLRFETREG